MSLEQLIMKLPTQDPLLYLLVFVTLVYGSTEIFSKKNADKFGLLGAFARWLADSKKRAIERDRTLADQRLDDERQIRRDIQKERDYLRRENRLLKTWVQTAELRWHNVGSHLASLGMEMPPPPLQPWVEFWENNQNEDE